MLVQTLIPKASIETFDVRVLGRLARVDEVKLHTVVIGPGIKGAPSQFGAVIDDQNVRISAFPCDPLQHFHDPLTGQ